MLKILKTIINTSFLTIITITNCQIVLAQTYKTEIIDGVNIINLDNGLQIINGAENTPQNNGQNSATMTLNHGNNKTNVEITTTPNSDNPKLTNLQITETSIKNTYLNVVKTNVLGVDCTQSVPVGFITNSINMNGKINSTTLDNKTIYFDAKNPYSQLVSQVCKK